MKIFILIVAIIIEMANFTYFFRLPESKEPIPGSDVSLYWYLGELIKEKGILSREIESYFFSPVYALLYFLFTISGNSVRYASIFSGISFVASVPLVFTLTKNVFNKHTAILSALIFVLYKPLLFYSLLPIKTMFFILLLLTFLNLSQKALNTKSQKLYFAMGVISGIAMNTEGLFLPVFFISALYVIVAHKINLKSFLFLISGLIISLAPFSIRNYMVNNNPYPLPLVSGIHLYIGNNFKAQGIYTSIPGIRPNAFGHYFDAKHVAEIELKRKLSDGEVNRFWKKKAFEFMLNAPERFLKLYFRKILLSINNFEIPNNFNINVIERKIPLLKYNILTFSFLFPLSILGILACIIKKERKAGLLILLAIIYPFILSLFFITSRYRIIWTVLLIPFASYFVLNTRISVKNSLLLFPLLLLYSTTKLQLLPPRTVKLMERSYTRREQLTEKLVKIDRELRNPQKTWCIN